METKKEPGAELSRKSGLFLGVGVTLALSMVITAFEWKSYGDLVVDLRAVNVDSFPESIIIPPTKILPPAPKPRALVVVTDKPDVEVDPPIIDIDAPDGTTVAPIPPVVEMPEVAEIDIPFIVVEEPASPKGGLGAFFRYVGDHIKYPSQARRMGIEGRVFVEFVIGKDGTLTDVKVIKGIGGGCDEEALRVVESSPPWTPGKQRGKPVRQRLTLPIIFKLG
jgi:protein TonB